MAVFGRRRRSSSTHGAFSPIINADGNTGIISFNPPVGGHPLLGAPQSFQAYVQDLTGSYYERNPLVKAFIAFLEENDRGYFAVEAEPGIGKSAFAAWVTAREETCSAHFLELSLGTNRTATVVRSLGAQLIRAWELHDLAPGGLLPAGSGDPAWLPTVIEAAAARRDSEHSNRRIVIVVDALNAAHDYPNSMLPFGLPEHLPRGVFVVVTSRAGQLKNLPPAQARHVRLRPENAENQAALRSFLKAAAREDGQVGRALQEHEVAGETLVRRLIQASAGSWVYAHYALESIRLDPAMVLRLPALPPGLGAYYDRYILRLCRTSPVQAERIALLAALGAAREPLDARGLCTLAEVDDPALVEDMMQDGLRPFCKAIRTDDGSLGLPRYSPDHPSLREYLSGAGADGVPDADAQLRERIGRAYRSAHDRICDRYLTAWGGLGSGLPILASQPELAAADNGYALRSLIFHLLEAGRAADIHRLLELELGDGQANLWYVAHERAGGIDGYLRDVELARTATQETATVLRYRLMEASAARAATVLPPAVVQELVKRQLRTPDQALARAERVNDPGRRAQILLPLIPQLPPGSIARACAMIAASGAEHRGELLAAVAARRDLNAERTATAIALIMEGDEYGEPFAGPLAMLARQLPPDQLSQLLPHSPWPADEDHARIIAEFFRDPDRTRAMRTALEHAGKIANCYNAGRLIAALLPDALNTDFGTIFEWMRQKEPLDGPQDWGPLAAALAAHVPLNEIKNLLATIPALGSPYGGALGDLSPRGSEFSELMHAAYLACGYYGMTEWPDILAALAPRLCHRDVLDVLNLATKVRCFVNHETAHALARNISAAESRRLLNELGVPGSASKEIDQDNRFILLSALLERLPEDEAHALAAAESRAVSAAEEDLPLKFPAEHLPANERRAFIGNLCSWISSGYDRYDSGKRTLARLAPHLSHEEVTVVLDKVAENWAWNPDARSEAIDALAQRLPDDLLTWLARGSGFAEPDSECFTALAELGKFQSPERRAQTGTKVLAIAGSLVRHGSMADAIQASAPLLSPESGEIALGMLEPVDVPFRVRAIDALSGCLADEILPRALALATEHAHRLGWVVSRLPNLLTRLARAGHHDSIDALLGRLLEYLGSDMNCSVEEFISFIPALTPEQARRAWDNVLARENLRGHRETGRPEVLAALVPYLPRPMQKNAAEQALAALAESKDGSSLHHDDLKARARTLGHLLRVAVETPDTVTSAVQKCLRDAHRKPLYPVIREFGTAFPPPLSDYALERAFAESEDDKSWGNFTLKAVAAVAPSLTQEQALRAAHAVAEYGPGTNTITALAALAPRHWDSAPNMIAVTALELLEAPSAWPRADDLYQLMPFLPDPGRQTVARVFLAVTSVKTARWKPDPAVLRDLALGRLEDLYTIVTAVENTGYCATAQSQILQHLGKTGAHQAFRDKRDLYATWPAALDRANLASLIASATWWLHREGGSTTIDRVMDTVFDVCRWWP